MSTVIINGKIHKFSGSLSIIGNKYYVNGKEVTDWNDLDKDVKHVEIKIEGDVEKLQVDNCDTIEVSGRVGSIKTHNGNVTAQAGVDGNVETHNGNIMCGKVGGDASSYNGNVMHA